MTDEVPDETCRQGGLNTVSGLKSLQQSPPTNRFTKNEVCGGWRIAEEADVVPLRDQADALLIKRV